MTWASALPDQQLAIDSDVLTRMRNGDPFIRSKITAYFAHRMEPPRLTSVTVFEAFSGFENERARRGVLPEDLEEKKRALEVFVATYDVLPFDDAAARLAARLFYKLGGRNIGKGWRDLFIAATAHAHGFGVATMNERDFKKVGDAFPPDDPTPLRLAIWKP